VGLFFATDFTDFTDFLIDRDMVFGDKNGILSGLYVKMEKNEKKK
jgi:hypothetical protein